MALLTKLQNRIAQTREKRERGAVLVLTALVMLLLLFIAAFATDLGAWYRQGQEQQRAADVGALNGIQAYDAEVRDYFEGLGFVDWNSPGLTPAQLMEADRLGLIAASNTIIGLLETSGLVFTDQGTPSLAMNPLDPTQVSTWTIEATDGTRVVITRSLFQSGLDSMNNPVYERVIDVQVIAPGEQYFSNIIRDAPEIERSASSRLSNCGAVCSTPIELSPPFSGFDAAGNGDGWAPLLRNGRGGNEIWAINHHSSNKDAGAVGSIICMDRSTLTFCDDFSNGGNNGRVPLTSYRTNTRPTDYIHVSNDGHNGKIYFTAGYDGNSPETNIKPESSGLACFDTDPAVRDWCNTEYVQLFDFTRRGDTNINGPIQYDDKLWVVSHSGQIACVNLDMTKCGEWNLLSAGHADARAEDSIGRQNNIELHDGKLYATLHLNNDQTAFECFNLDTEANCWTGAPRIEGNIGGRTNDRFTFFQLSPTGTPIGICIANTNIDKHACAQFNGGTIQTWTNGVGEFLDDNHHAAFIGDSFAVTTGGRARTFFGGGVTDNTFCWDWSLGTSGVGQACATTTASTQRGIIPAPVIPNPPRGATEPYAYAQVTDNCIICLGDGAIFFTIDVDTLDTCTGSEVTTQVEPCDCADGSERYGVLELPDALKVQLDSATGRITGTTGAVAPLEGNLLTGPLDLSVFNGDPGPLELTIEVQSKVNGVDLVWKDDFAFDLELVVQPTLTN